MDTGNWDPATCPLCNKRCTNWETVHASCQMKQLRDQRDSWKKAAEFLYYAVEWPKYAYEEADEIEELFEAARKLEEE